MSQTKNDNDVLKKTGMSDEVYRKQYRIGGGIERKAVDIEEGVFEGHSAGIGNRDRGDDVIMPGAFSKTISERVSNREVKLLNGHQSRDTKNVWGVVTEAAEKRLGEEERANVANRAGVEKDEAPTHVLWSKFDVFSGKEGQDALRKIDEGILDGLSIGFRTVQTKFVKDDSADEDVDAELAWLRGNGVREIHELAWWETSLVTWGMNQAARVVPGSVKDVLQRSKLIEELSSEDVDEKQVRYTIRSLKRLIGDADECEAILDTDEAREACERVEEAAKKAEGADVDEDAEEELDALRDELTDKQNDAETPDSQVTVEEETEAEAEDADEDEEKENDTEEEGTTEEINVKVEIDGVEMEVEGTKDEVASVVHKLKENGDVPSGSDDANDGEEENDAGQDDSEDSPESSEEKSSEEETEEEVAGDAGDGRSDEHFDEVASHKLAEMRVDRTREKLLQTIEEFKE